MWPAGYVMAPGRRVTITVTARPGAMLACCARLSLGVHLIVLAGRNDAMGAPGC